MDLYMVGICHIPTHNHGDKFPPAGSMLVGLDDNDGDEDDDGDYDSDDNDDGNDDDDDGDDDDDELVSLVKSCPEGEASTAH